MPPLVVRRALAEFVGTMFLVTSIVGSGVAAVKLTDDKALQLLYMGLAAGAVLGALILAMQSVSADFNPAVTAVGAALGVVKAPVAAVMVLAQLAGGFVGAVVANIMWDLDPITLSDNALDSGAVRLGEVVATAGLVLVIFCVIRAGRSALVSLAAGAYLAVGFIFTSSGSFANPAVSFGRAFSDTLAGIKPGSVPMFIVMELIGAAIAYVIIRVVYPLPTEDAVVERPGDPRIGGSTKRKTK